MCWTVEASTTLTAAGVAGVGYGVYTRQPKELVITLAYFTIMEALQALSYPVAGICHSSLNQLLTLLSFMHIAFQPFFINMVMMYLIPNSLRKKIALPVYCLCGIAAAVTLLQMYPFAWAGTCIASVPLCGSELCAVMGDWHLAWTIPLNGLMNNLWPMPLMGMPGYFIVGLVLPFFYGSWRANLYHIVFGPLFAYLVTNSINEGGAVWCTFSIALLLSILGERPVRKYMRIQSVFGHHSVK